MTNQMYKFARGTSMLIKNKNNHMDYNRAYEKLYTESLSQKIDKVFEVNSSEEDNDSDKESNAESIFSGNGRAQAV